MEILNKQEGILKVTVASEGNCIRAGRNVVIETIVDNFKNIFVCVTSATSSVRLEYYDTDINWLLGK